jgi:hypothetical protein
MWRFMKITFRVIAGSLSHRVDQSALEREATAASKK